MHARRHAHNIVIIHKNRHNGMKKMPRIKHHKKVNMMHNTDKFTIVHFTIVFL